MERETFWCLCCAMQAFLCICCNRSVCVASGGSEFISEMNSSLSIFAIAPKKMRDLAGPDSRGSSAAFMNHKLRSNNVDERSSGSKYHPAPLDMGSAPAKEIVSIASGNAPSTAALLSALEIHAS